MMPNTPAISASNPRAIAANHFGLRIRMEARRASEGDVGAFLACALGWCEPLACASGFNVGCVSVLGDDKCSSVGVIDCSVGLFVDGPCCRAASARRRK